MTSIYCNQWHPPCSIYMHDSLFSQPLSKSSLAPSTSYSIHFFIQSRSAFRSTCPYPRNLYCCSTKIISSNPSLSLNSLLGTLFYLNSTHPYDHFHLCPQKCHLIFLSYRLGLTSMQHTTLHITAVQYPSNYQ